MTEKLRLSQQVVENRRPQALGMVITNLLKTTLSLPVSKLISTLVHAIGEGHTGIDQAIQIVAPETRKIIAVFD